MIMLNKIGIIGFCAFFSMNINAMDLLYDEELPMVWSSIITLSAGPAWAAPGQNQFLYPNPVINTPIPLVLEEYRYNSRSGILASGEIFFGLQHLIQPMITGELGIGLAGATGAKATGVINVNGVAGVNSFAYKVVHGRAELKGKLISNYFLKVQPYISGSFGAGFNSSHAYVPDTVSYSLYSPNWFVSSSNIAFAYTLGLGVQTKINRNWQVGIGYEIADWGKSYLGPDPTTRLNGPGLTHLYVSELLLSLSYLF
jgi:hypothetical protein